MNLKSVECKNISEEDLSNIKISIEQIKSDILELEAEINNLKTSTDPNSQIIIENLKLEKIWAENYLSEIEQQMLFTPCPYVAPE